MADNYVVITGERVSVQLLPGLYADGQDSTIQAKPSGVIFHVVVVVNEATFANPDLLEAAIDDVAGPYADHFNHDVTVPGVVGITSFPDTDANDNYAQVVSVIVHAANAAIQTTVNGPITNAIPDRFEPWIAAVRASLDALPTSPGGLTSPPTA